LRVLSCRQASRTGLILRGRSAVVVGWKLERIIDQIMPHCPSGTSLCGSYPFLVPLLIFFSFCPYLFRTLPIKSVNPSSSTSQILDQSPSHSQDVSPNWYEGTAVSDYPAIWSLPSTRAHLTKVLPAVILWVWAKSKGEEGCLIELHSADFNWFSYSKPEEFSIVTVPLPKIRDNDVLVGNVTVVFIIQADRCAIRSKSRLVVFVERISTFTREVCVPQNSRFLD